MYTKTYFFRVKGVSSADSANAPECVVQMPSANDLEQMHGMPAGADEDQALRLTHMTQIVRKCSGIPLATTDSKSISKEWELLFAAIKQGDEVVALNALNKIPKRDAILHAFLAVHPLSYLQELIAYCIKAKSNGKLVLNSDIVITTGTLEVLIKDLAATLGSTAKVHFSFGLPTHHAFNTEGSGFCILDKTSILLMRAATSSPVPLKYVIIGTDVNRDNGLNYNLLKIAPHLDICHIDVFDSRVYPMQDADFISEVFKKKGKEVGQKIRCWSEAQLKYYAVDLSLTVRTTNSAIHPALVFAFKKIAEQLELAKKEKTQIMLFLPTGWDSHEKETAPCGKYVDGEMMGRAEAQKTRFNDKDLMYFYEQLFELYQENKSFIAGVYWGLEGGYDRLMYTKQIELLMAMIKQKLIPQEALDDARGMELG